MKLKNVNAEIYAEGNVQLNNVHHTAPAKLTFRDLDGNEIMIHLSSNAATKLHTSLSAHGYTKEFQENELVS